MEGRGVGTDVGGRDAGAGVIGGFGVVVEVDKGRVRRGRWRQVEGWRRRGRRSSGERRALDEDEELSDMVELLKF